MSLFLTTGTKKPRDGKPYSFFVLRENYYDPESKAMKQRYIGYVGKEPVLTESKARAICERKGISLEDLRAVNGLTIVPDEEEDDGA